MHTHTHTHISALHMHTHTCTHMNALHMHTLHTHINALHMHSTHTHYIHHIHALHTLICFHIFHSTISIDAWFTANLFWPILQQPSYLLITIPYQFTQFSLIRPSQVFLKSLNLLVYHRDMTSIQVLLAWWSYQQSLH